MRLIKLAAISFIILFLLVTVFSLFIPSNIRISRATNIAGDDTVVFANIKNLSNWRNWHPALKSIPENEYSSGADMLKVHGTTINLENVKKDEIAVKMAEDGGRPVWSGFNFIRREETDSITLQWYMDFKLRWYPWEKFRSLFYENIYGMQMEQGLNNLKALSRAGRS